MMNDNEIKALPSPSFPFTLLGKSAEHLMERGDRDFQSYCNQLGLEWIILTSITNYQELKLRAKKGVMYNRFYQESKANTWMEKHEIDIEILWKRQFNQEYLTAYQMGIDPYNNNGGSSMGYFTPTYKKK